MPNESAIEIDKLGQVEGLARRILDGEVFVLRRGLQQLGLFETIVEDTLEGIRRSAGLEVAATVERGGFDRIHEWIKAADIPRVTDAIYEVMTSNAPNVLVKLVPGMFPGGGSYYFEQSPNVRFHIPFDDASAHRREYDKFAEKFGLGKIAAHGPHRDPWVDCPDNVINVWIAISPVKRGNGMAIFAQDYKKEFSFRDGYIAPGTKLQHPMYFDLDPGDVLLFHSNHLHASELNRTQLTRYVVSYRVAFGTPHYPHGHYHQYRHVGLASGPLRWLSSVPQNLQWSFVRYQFRRLKYKITGRGKMTGSDGHDAEGGRNGAETYDKEIRLSSFPIGSVRAVSRNVCVARVGENQFSAVSRYCPHMGGDLAGGWLEGSQVVCPLHSLPFDLRTGASPCRSLKPLRVFECSVRDGHVSVRIPEVDASPTGTVLSSAKGILSAD